MRAQGIDIAPKNQPDYVHMEHNSFLMPQVSNGLTIWNNEGLPEETKDVEFVFPYHYLRSGWSWIDQYDRFITGCEPYKVSGFMVDFEGRGNNKSETFAGYLKKFLDQLMIDFPYKRSVTYSGRFTIQDWLYKNGFYFLRDNPEKYPLMIAQYPYYGWNDILREIITMPVKWRPVLPAGITEWKFWQYSADGNKKGAENGIPKQFPWSRPDVDLDVFNGSVIDLREWLSIDAPVPPPPDCINYIDALDNIQTILAILGPTE